MEDKNNRPVFLNLFAIRLPIEAMASIVHRLTGFLLVILLPVGMYMLEVSLRSPVDFEHLTVWLAMPLSRGLLLVVIWTLAQHFFSGLRHILLDIDIGVGRQAARVSAWSTFVLSLTIAMIAGIYL